VNHRVFERKWRSRVRSRAFLFECHNLQLLAVDI
jgi:hypothetical protein